MAVVAIVGIVSAPTAVQAAPGDNFLESSHTVSCGKATVTLRNVSPWIYPMSVEINGVASYGPRGGQQDERNAYWTSEGCHEDPHDHLP